MPCLANGYLLALAARSTGGQLWGMTVWSYNVQDQGLFGDSDPAPYPRDTLFDRLCAAFSDWRAIMEGTGGQARLLVWVPDDWMQMHLGTTRQAVRDSPIDFGCMLPLIRANVPLAVMGTLPDLHASGIRTLLVLGTPKTMAANDYVRLTNYMKEGGRVLATRAVGGALLPEAKVQEAREAPAHGTYHAVAVGHGQMVLLPDEPLSLDEAGWVNALQDGNVISGGMLVSTPDQALFYQPGSEVVPVPAN